MTPLRCLLGPEKERQLDGAARDTCRVPGDMAEVGVLRGGSAKIIADACPRKTLHLYDTFTGFPWSESDILDECPFEETDVDEVREYLAGCRVEFHVGIFPATAFDTLYSFVFLDADLYRTTADALAFFLPRLSPGGMIVFDDVGWPNCPGVERAIAERGLPIDMIASFLGVYRHA